MKKTLLCLILSTSAFARVNIPLTVQETLFPGSTSGVARTNEPVTVGVPLPDSAGISSTSVLGLTGATAAQFMVEGKWPSGNIKWVKVRAIVPSLAAGGTAALTLTDSGAGNFGGGNLATDNGSTITVATGAATFTIKKANFNGIDQVVIGSTTVVASGASQGFVVLGPDPTQAYPANVTCLPASGGSACSTVYSSANDPNSTAVIEENGPAMAVINASGSHVDANGHVYLHFTARLYFFQNKSYVKVTSILRNADYGTSNTFATAYKGHQGYELRIAPNIAGTLNYNIAAPTCSGAVCSGTLNQPGGTDSAYLYQAESNLMNANGWCNYSGCVVPSPLTGYAVVQNGAAVTTGTGGQYPQGWADISDANGVGVQIGQYELAAYGNKSLEFRGGGTDVRVGIWASENNTTSTSTTTANKPYYLAWPQYSINDVYLNFHASALPSPANSFLSLQHYLAGRAASASYDAAGVFFYPLLDPTEENTFYANAVSTASPAISNRPLADLGTTDTYNWPLNVWRYYRWPQGGGFNQMEFRLSRLLNFIRRGYSGGLLDTAHFYKLIAELGLPRSDGFNWRDKSTSEKQYLDYPTAASANSSLGTSDLIEVDQEHGYWWGMPDYYFMTGDETMKDAVIEGPKDAFMDTNSANNLITNGRFWNSRAVGNTLSSTARLYLFLSAIGDPDAPTLLNQGQTVYNLQVKPDLCVSGYPAGCTPDVSGADAGANQRGTSRVRGITYQWGDTIFSNGCPGYPTTARRDFAPFMAGILLRGLWEFRQAYGPSWSDYNASFDIGYGIAQGALGEMYVDNGTSSWAGNGFLYKQAIDIANACNVGAGGGASDYYFSVQNPNGYWDLWYFAIQYLGSGPNGWQRKVTQNIQSVFAGSTPDSEAELYQYTIGNLIRLTNHPNSYSLSTVPITGFTDNGGGSYTISWSVPSGASAYRVKWSPNQIVDYIGYNAGTATFTGNPATTTNWFAATDAPSIPLPSGTTQSMTISTGVTGLTAANFMVKAYSGSGAPIGGGSSGGGGSPPPPPPPAPPTVSISAPAAGATVSGTVTVSASASSSVGIGNVQFKLDGANLGAAITGAGPYSVSWNTANATNASHSLTAVATDTAGTSTTSTAVSVTVSNAAGAPVITGVSAGSITSASAVISWQTDQNSSSQVAFGLTASYGQLTSVASNLVTSHSVMLNGLATSTTYHYQVISVNQQGTRSVSADFTFTTAAPSTSTPGGTAIPTGTWTRIPATGWQALIYGYDKSEYVSSRRAHCIWGGYKQYLSSEHNNGLVCYSFPENRWTVLENNGYWHSSHAGGAGHTVSVWAYMPDKDVLVYQTDGSGSNSPEQFAGFFWWYDVAGLSGQNREFSPQNWLGTTTPWNEMMTYDPYDQKLIFYDINGALEVCDPNTNSCFKPAIAGTAPPTTMNSPNMVYNSSNHTMYIYGGGQANIYTFACNTNACTTATAAQLTVTCSGAACVSGKPPARTAAGMAYSARDNIFLMAGGLNFYGSSTSGSTAYTDTWTFDPVALAWTQLTPASTYFSTAQYFTNDRLTYDPDSNVFVLISISGYGPTIYAFPYSAALNYGRVSNTYTPTPGSLNRVSPTSSTQSWAFDPAITSSNGQVYAGWIESGADGDNTVCGQTHHPYIQSTSNNSAWTPYPSGTMAQACVSIDPDLSGNTNDSKLHIAVVNGALWEVHEKINHNQGYYSAAFARQWTGTSWSGGAVGCFFAACGNNLRQQPQAMIANGNTPMVQVIEWNHSTYTPEGYLYVAQWNGTAWAPLGGMLNTTGSGTGTRAIAAALSTDGTNPAACWAEEVRANDRRTVNTTPQIQCAQWNGSSWARFGSSSLNQNKSAWAYDPSMTYAGGKFYIAWTERATAGNTQLFVCRWDSSSCTLLGGGALNLNTLTGWAAHPSLATDGNNVYVAWEEQPSLGQKAGVYAKTWNGSAWSQLGSSLNADPVNGSAEGVALTVNNTVPTAIWAELTYGNLRQVYTKQWNGSAWTGAAAPAAPVQVSCDVNGDGVVNAVDVQVAINQALGLSPCTTADLQQTGVCTVVDVQRVINASLGGSCRIGP